jgi:ribosomal silencing factor RsfS
VVHVFHPDMRKYYAIEDLWSDARTVVYENM